MKKNFTFCRLAVMLALGAVMIFVGCNAYDDDIEKINDRIDDLNAGEIATLEQQLTTLTATVDEVSNFANEEANKLAELTAGVKDQVDALQDELDTKATTAELNAAITSATADIQAKIDALGDDISDELAAAVAELKKAIVELETNSATKAELEDQLAALEESTAIAIASLQGEINDLEVDLDNLNDELSAAHKADIDELSAAHQADIDELSAAHQADIDELNAKIADLNAKIADLNTEVADLTAEVETITLLVIENCGDIVDLQSSITLMDDDIKLNTGAIAELQEQIAEIAILKDDIAKLQDAIAVNTGAIAAIEADCLILKGLIETNSANISTNTQSILALQQTVTEKVVELTGEITRVDSAISTINTTLTGLRYDVNINTEAITDLIVLSEALYKMIVDIEDSFDGWCGEFMETYWAELYKLNPNSQEWLDYYATIEKVILSAAENNWNTLAGMVEELDSWRKKITNLETDTKSLRDRIGTLETQVDLNTDAIAELLEQIQSVSYVPVSKGGVVNTNINFYESYMDDGNERVKLVEGTNEITSYGEMAFDIRPEKAAYAIVADYEKKGESIGAYFIVYENLTRAITSSTITGIKKVQKDGYDSGRIVVSFQTISEDNLDDAALALVICYGKTDIMSEYELIEREEVNFVPGIYKHDSEGKIIEGRVSDVSYTTVWSSSQTFTLMADNQPDDDPYAVKANVYDAGGWHQTFEVGVKVIESIKKEEDDTLTPTYESASITLAEVEERYNINLSVYGPEGVEGSTKFYNKNGAKSDTEWYYIVGNVFRINSDFHSVTASDVGGYMETTLNYKFGNSVTVPVNAKVTLTPETGEWTSDATVVWNYADAKKYIDDNTDQLIAVNDLVKTGANTSLATEEEIATFFGYNNGRISVEIKDMEGQAITSSLDKLTIKKEDGNLYLVVPHTNTNTNTNANANAVEFNKLYDSSGKKRYQLIVKTSDESGEVTYTVTFIVTLVSYPSVINTKYDEVFKYTSPLMSVNVAANDIYDPYASYFPAYGNYSGIYYLNRTMKTDSETRTYYKNNTEFTPTDITDKTYIEREFNEPNNSYTCDLSTTDWSTETDKFKFVYNAKFDDEHLMPYPIKLTSTVNATVE